MPPVHDHHTATTTPSAQPDQTGTPVSGHPPWCSPQHCFLDEDGVWVHKQEPVRWEESEVRFESQLLFPDGEHPPVTYLQLSIEHLRLTWRFVDTFLPIATARRLRDQLTAHLNAAAASGPGGIPSNSRSSGEGTPPGATPGGEGTAAGDDATVGA